MKFHRIQLTTEERAFLFKAVVFNLLLTLEPGRTWESREDRVEEPLFYDWEIEEPKEIVIVEEGVDSKKGKAEVIELSEDRIKAFIHSLGDYYDYVLIYWEGLKARGKVYSMNYNYHLWRLANILPPLSKYYKGMIEQKANPLFWEREVYIAGGVLNILEEYLPKDWYKKDRDKE